MIDWSLVDWHLVWQIAGGTWGATVIVTAAISLVAWVVGFVIQKTTRGHEENSGKG